MPSIVPDARAESRGGLCCGPLRSRRRQRHARQVGHGGARRTLPRSSAVRGARARGGALEVDDVPARERTGRRGMITLLTILPSP
jgi:hypothetical protein